MKGPAKIDINYRLEAVPAQLFGQRGDVSCRTGNHDIEVAETLVNVLQSGLHRFRLTHVGSEPHGICPELFERIYGVIHLSRDRLPTATLAP